MLKKLFFLLLLLPVFGFSLFPPNWKPSAFQLKISPFEEELLKNTIPIFEQSLIASGIPHTEFSRYKKQINALLQNFKQQYSQVNNYKKADILLQFLHNKLFRKYEEKITDLGSLFEKGIYNCVSSSYMYNYFAQKLGLTVRGALLSDHVFSQVNINNRWIDAETTVAFGFDAGKRKKAADVFAKRTGFVYVPSSRKGKKIHTINIRQYIAVIYSNLGANALEKKNSSLGLNRLYKSVRIYPTFPEGIQNLQAAYNQHAITFINQNRFPEAEKTLKELLFLFPNFQKANHNLRSLYFNWVNYLFDRSRYSEGLSIIDKHNRFFTPPEKESYYLLWVQNLLKKERNFAGAWKAIFDVRKRLPLSKRIQDYGNYVLQEYMTYLKQNQKIQEALKLLKSYQPPDNKALISKAFQFAELGDLESARLSLEKAILKTPDYQLIEALTQVSFDAATRSKKPDSAIKIAHFLSAYYKKFWKLRNYYNNIFKAIGQYYIETRDGLTGIKKLQAFYQYNFLTPYVAEAVGGLFYRHYAINRLLSRRLYSRVIPLLKKGLQLTRKAYPSMINTYKNARMNHGIQFFKNRDFPEAYSAYVKLIKEYPRDPGVRRNFTVIVNAYLRALSSSPKKQKQIQTEAQKLLNR